MKRTKNTSLPETGGKKVSMSINKGKIIVDVLNLLRLP